jgi:hypothetical protein
MEKSQMKKVVSPIENKDGKTFWQRLGCAFLNRDGSTNVYLNAFPTNGKIQIRDLDEEDLRPRPRRDAGGQPAGRDSNQSGQPQDDLPF